MSGGSEDGTPGSAGGGFVRRAAPEPNKRALYVGGLDARVTEDILRQIFETAGHVLSVKIIPEKNVSCIIQAIGDFRLAMNFLIQPYSSLQPSPRSKHY